MLYRWNQSARICKSLPYAETVVNVNDFSFFLQGEITINSIWLSLSGFFQRWRRSSRVTEIGSLECRLLKVLLLMHTYVRTDEYLEGYPKQIRMAHLAVVGKWPCFQLGDVPSDAYVR